LFAKTIVTNSMTTIALVSITVEIAGLTAFLSFLNLSHSKDLKLVFLPS